MRFLFFYDPPTTEIYTLSLHDALPIYGSRERVGDARSHRQVHGVVDAPRSAAGARSAGGTQAGPGRAGDGGRDRKSTRLNSSHMSISYAVFCLKKKNNSTSRLQPSPSS